MRESTIVHISGFGRKMRFPVEQLELSEGVLRLLLASINVFVYASNLARYLICFTNKKGGLVDMNTVIVKSQLVSSVMRLFGSE